MMKLFRFTNLHGQIKTSVKTSVKGGLSIGNAPLKRHVATLRWPSARVAV